MLATCSGALLLASSTFLAGSALRIRGWAPAACGLMVLAAAQVVMLTLLLSAFGAYRRDPMLVAQIAVMIAVLAAWHFSGRGSLRVGALPTLSCVLRFARSHPTIAALCVASAIAMAVELALALALPPNTWDSLMYHLSRVALWIQNQGVFGLDGGTIYEREYAPNGEILYGWTMLLSEGDRLAAVVPWTFGLGCGSLVFWGARRLRFERPAALFAGTMFLLLPQIIVQASSTLVDLSAAFFVGAFILFGLRAIDDLSRGDLLIAALALGLALGTKGTTFLAIPAMALVLGAAIIKRRPPRNAIAVGLASLAVGAAVLSGPGFAENLIQTGSVGGDAGRSQLRVSSLETTTTRTLWTFVDWPGLAGTLPTQLLQPVHDRIWPNGLDPANDSYVSEDGIGFGPQVSLLLIPLLLLLIVSPRTRRDRRVIALASASYLGAYIVVLETGPNASHTMVTGVLLAAPLFAVLYERSWLRHLGAFVAFLVIVPVLLQNGKKPLYPESVLGADRAGVQSQQHPFAPALGRIDEVLAPHARIAYLGPSDGTWDYPFFGPNLDRFVHRVQTPVDASVERADVTEMVADYDLDAVVFAGIEPPQGIPTIDIGEIAFSDHQIWLTDGT